MSSTCGYPYCGLDGKSPCQRVPVDHGFYCEHHTCVTESCLNQKEVGDICHECCKIPHKGYFSTVRFLEESKIEKPPILVVEV